MAPKRQRGASGSRAVQTSSSDSASIGHPAFLSAAAHEEFERLGTKGVVRERGFLPVLADGNLRQEIAHRQWEWFCEAPLPVPLAGVREFFANAKVNKNGYSQVRGFVVDYTVEAIRRVMRLPAPIEDVEDWGLKTRYDVDLNEMIRDMCVPGTVWAVRRGGMEPAHFPASTLNRYAKAWNMFICSNIAPSSHAHDVTVDRAILLYGILTHRYIDLGMLVHKNIMKFMKGTSKGPIPHGSIITRLCNDVGVGWLAEEPLQMPMAPIDHTTIQQLEQWPGGVANEDGLGFWELEEPEQVQEQEEAGGSPVIQQAASGPPIGAQEFHQFARRTTRRIDAMYDIHSRFALDLTQALGTAFRASGVDIEWPVFGAGAVFPPPDSPPPEEGGSSGL